MYDDYSDGWGGGALVLSYADESPSEIGTFELEDGELGNKSFTLEMFSPFAPPDPPAQPPPPPMIPAPPSAPLPPAHPACQCEFGVRLKQKIPVGTWIPPIKDDIGVPELSCVGDYATDGQRTPDGRPVYKKSDSSHYMYWWAEFTHWRVGLDITESDATCASLQSGRDGPCPEQASEW